MVTGSTGAYGGVDGIPELTKVLAKEEEADKCSYDKWDSPVVVLIVIVVSQPPVRMT